MSGIEGYKDVLNELVEKGSSEFINNSSINHAAVMIETLFRHAEGEVRILTDHLSPEVYDRLDVKESANNFLQKADNRIYVIMQLRKEGDEITIPQNEFIKYLKGNKDQIRFFKAIDLKLKDFANHFMVVKTQKGNYALRFETNPIERLATGSFNSEEIGKTLCEFFDKYMKSDAVAEIDNVWQN